MSLKTQQDFSARLFTDEELCRDFLIAPETVGLKNGLDKEDIDVLKDILPRQLKMFADSLVWKRLHEVGKLLPLTLKALEKNFAEEFRKFSKNFNPKSVKKHHEDAVNFAAYLIKNRSFEKNVIEIIKFEKIKLEFFVFRKRICWGFFSHDLYTKEEQRFGKLRLWLRIGQREIIV